MTSPTDSDPADTGGATRVRAGTSEAATSLRARYDAVRELSMRIAEPLSPEDATAQSMTDASPTKWHLAHTSWFFETFVLDAYVPTYPHYAHEFRVLFNSYYNAVGAQYPRPKRGILTRPGFAECKAYRAHVDEHVAAFFERNAELPDDVAAVIEIGLQHEQQHQELMLTDVKHVLSCNPLHPVYRNLPAAEGQNNAPKGWHPMTEGVVEVGHDGRGFAFDNEGPRHRQYLHSYELGTRLVTNAEYLAFIGDGGYLRPEFWLSEGWAIAQAEGWKAPSYWEERDGEWFTFTLGGLRSLNGEGPVTHVSFYEADAYAKWAGCRLPTEHEWEAVAEDMPVVGNFVDHGWLHPVPAGTVRGTLNAPVHQMYGDVWEWTLSPYTPFPGYAPPDGALGEYNGKFMSNQMVLRGGSCATSQSHIRATYRNFFAPHARWQFSGFRLARSV